MSNVVGSLVVNLSAHTADFDKGLKSASAAARQFSREALANDIFKTKSGGGAGGGSPLDPIVDDAKKLQPHLSKVQKLLNNIARLSIGGRGARLLGNAGGALSEITGMSGAMLGVSMGGIAAAYAAKKLGDEIRSGRKAATELGLTYNQFVDKTNALTFNKKATAGLEAMSHIFENMWRTARGISGEILGWVANTLLLAPAEFLAGGPVDWSAGERLKLILKEEAARRKLNESVEETLRNMDKMAGDRVSTARMSNIEASTFEQLGAVDELIKKAPDLANLGQAVKDSIRSSSESLRALAVNATLDAATDDLAKMGREADVVRDRIERLRKTLKDSHTSDKKIANLMPAIEEAGKLASARIKQQEATKKAADEEKSLRDRLKSLVETPITKFAEVAKDLAAGFNKGIIGADQRNAALKKARESAVSSLMSDLKYSPGAASIMQAGSRELFNAIADRSQGPSAELEEVRRLVRIVTEVRNKMPVAEGAAL
jgi:Skp family chaperone for outer membrane proteins